MFEERMMPAILCGILTELEARGAVDEVFSKVDWDEVGCSQAYALGWWAEHKRRDTKRRAEAADRAERERVAQAALGKLSPREREALGLR
jgi:hypothetical protein